MNSQLFFEPADGGPVVNLGACHIDFDCTFFAPAPVRVWFSESSNIVIHRTLTAAEYRAALKWIRTRFNGLRKSQKTTKRRLRFERNRLLRHLS